MITRTFAGYYSDRQRVFKDKEVLEKMLIIARTGEKLSTLAEMFKCDRTSIRFQLIKAGVPLPPSKGGAPNYKTLKERVKNRRKKTYLDPFDGEPVNIGKDYEDYLKGNKKLERNPEKLIKEANTRGKILIKQSW